MIVQLDILSGKKAGTSWVARRFPVTIGRAANCDLRTDEPGVWDQHLRLEFVKAEGVLLSVETDALATVNGSTAQRTLLRNGDSIELGGLRLQFWLGATRQASYRVTEWLTWLGIAAVCLGQVALVYWLLGLR